MTQNLKVLVVEDDEDDFFLLKHFIQYSELWNIDFTLSASYEDGLQKYRNESFDLCFLDHYLGVKTGIDFLREVNKDYTEIPIILLTGLDNAAIDNSAIESGAADYIPKNNMSQALLERSIRHALERHKQNTLLNEERQKYQSLFENSLEAIFVADSSFKIVEINASFRKLLKTEDQESLSLKCIFKNPEDFEEIVKFDEETRTCEIDRVVIKDSDGAELVVRMALSLIPRLSESEPLLYQGVIHDITDLEEAQMKLIESENFELTGRMARIIGHEVRNPLTNILLATDELKDALSTVSEEDVELFEMVKRSAKRIAGLIDDLLNSTKSIDLNLAEVAIESIIQSSIEECNDRLSLRKIKLIKPDLTRATKVLADNEKLQIAVTNIIINAIEAMVDTENPELSIEVTTDAKSMRLTIADNGKGMSPTTVKKIFDPFFSDRHGGLGLGMTNVKNIMIQHNGLLTVDSELGKGTAFTLKLNLL